MKDNIIELLLHFFEKSLSQLNKDNATESLTPSEGEEAEDYPYEETLLVLKTHRPESTRVITEDERRKLTKASYQFVMRMKQWGVLNAPQFESVLHQLESSESRIVTLEETKWIIKNVLSEVLHPQQVPFLDLLLYQSEEEYTSH